MSRRSTFVRKMAERRNVRAFERAVRDASPTLQQELRAIALHQQMRGL